MTALAALALCGWVAAAGADPLAPLGKGKARVFTAQPGEKITAQPAGGKGKGVVLSDGDEVQIEDNGVGVGDGEAVATIRVGKRKLTLPGVNLISEESLQRSPDGKWAVLMTMSGCGDVCHGVAWLLGPAVRVRFSEDVGPEIQVSWRPDGGEVAVGGAGHVHVIALPEAKVVKQGEFEAPAYAPDGRLFMRGPGESDAVHQWIRGGKPRRVLAVRGQPPPLEEGEYYRAMEPPTFEGGTLQAIFERKSGKEYRSVALAELGKDAAGGAPPAPVAKALASIVDEAVAPAAAAKLAADEGKANPTFARPLASAANTRGLRLYQAGKGAEALPLFEVAAQLDATYGMPRYNAARVLAARGDAAGCARWLGTLKALGAPQRARLDQARRDPAFGKVAASAEVRAVFE